MGVSIVPGVKVQALFDVLPPLPAPSGIVGVVGVVDRPPAKLTGVSKVSEIRELLGPGTLISLQEAVHALSNGATEAVISPVTGGSAASLVLNNTNSEPAVLLKCRFNRNWGIGTGNTGLHANVNTSLDAGSNVVRIELSLVVDGRVVEKFEDLRVAPGQADDLFETINRHSRLVVAIDPGHQNETPEPGEYTFAEPPVPILVKVKGSTTEDLFELRVNSDAELDNLKVVISDAGSAKVNATVLSGPAFQEEFNNLVMDPDSDDYLPYVLLTQSRLIHVQAVSSIATASLRLPNSTASPVPFSDGSSPSVDKYRDAVALLEEDSRIDLVVAAIEPSRSESEVHQIHQSLVAHAVKMADDGAPRIAFGAITTGEANDLEQIKDHASAIRSRRFVLVAPPGAAGLVAGSIGRLSPKISPTFKPLPLHGLAPSEYRESQLNRLLGSSINLLVVQDRAGRGVVVLRGLDTKGDQISVTRVADKALRETKAISENFIGRLNSEDARIALQQQIIAVFTQMEKEGALVPSTDGTDPAFIVDVYSTQDDFAKGIVRIDIAVRPVRAIDFIFATIRVKN